MANGSRPDSDRAIAVLTEKPPPLPELSSEPDYRELAAAYATFVIWLHHQWPALVATIKRQEHRDRDHFATVNEKLTILIAQRRPGIRAEHVLLIATALLSLGSALLSHYYH